MTLYAVGQGMTFTQEAKVMITSMTVKVITRLMSVMVMTQF